MTGRFLPYPAIYAVYKLAQPPDSRTYSAEVTSFLSNLPHHRRLRPIRRPVIIQHPPVCVKRFCKKILADFPGFPNAALWVFQKTRESPPCQRGQGDSVYGKSAGRDDPGAPFPAGGGIPPNETALSKRIPQSPPAAVPAPFSKGAFGAGPGPSTTQAPLAKGGCPEGAGGFRSQEVCRARRPRRAVPRWQRDSVKRNSSKPPAYS